MLICGIYCETCDFNIKIEQNLYNEGFHRFVLFHPIRTFQVDDTACIFLNNIHPCYYLSKQKNLLNHKVVSILQII